VFFVNRVSIFSEVNVSVRTMYLKRSALCSGGARDGGPRRSEALLLRLELCH
jgi:hypothetical protein